MSRVQTIFKNLPIGKLNSMLTLWTAAITAFAALCAFIPGLWIFDLFSQFRLILGLILLLCICSLGLMRVRFGLVLGTVVFVLNALPIAAMRTPAPGVHIEKPVEIAILSFNTEFQHNNSYGLFDELVAKRRPDLIALVEVDQKWIDSIGASTKSYPYSKTVSAGAGLALYSKFPIIKCDVRYFGRSHHPRIVAVVKVGERDVNLIIVHPTTPKSDASYQERDRELSLIGDEIKALAAPSILIGDLNCGPWAPAFAKLLSTGLHDSEQGFGPQPSWPARVGRVIEYVPVPPIVPIDHILVSAGIAVLEREAGPAIHSDHLPVFAKVAITK